MIHDEIIDCEWWTIEHRLTGRPLANTRGWPCIFSSRDYAREAIERVRLPAARIRHHGSPLDVIKLLEQAARFGSTGIVIDPGQQCARWFALDPAAWDFEKLRQAKRELQEAWN